MIELSLFYIISLQGAARGLVFLHHVCVPHVIHRDIKASNILLDADFNAFIADFGLARLISAYDSHLSTRFAGTVGYIPPEYGQCALASTKGDVYSFGIVLLEILTGKRPTDRFFTDKEDSDLISWVRHSVLQSKILEILDPELILELDAELRDHVDRLVGGVDSYVHPHFSPGSSQASSPGRSPLFSPDVHPVHFSPSFAAAAAAPGANLSCVEMRGGGHVRLPPRFSLGLSSVSSPASNARRSSFGYSPMSGFDGIPEFECTFRECGMKQELVRVLGLAVWCTEDMRSKRPSMLQISRLLDTIGTQRL
jgi:serine/threonine protein kinase